MYCSCSGGPLVVGSTPVHFFTFPIPTEYIDKIIVTYAQEGRVILEKSMADIEFFVTDDEVNRGMLKLSQADTYLFDPRKLKYCMQIKVKTDNGEVIESEIHYYRVSGSLNKEVI